MVEAMQIDTIICPESIEEKLARKHHVSMCEVRQALLTHLSIIFCTIFELSTRPIVKLGHSAFPGSYYKGSHDSTNSKVG
jgi:hypothetical protein